MDSIRVPNTCEGITVGSIVILSRFPDTKWVLQYGWFSYEGERQEGWYFSSIPAQTVIPVTDEDLEGLEIVSGGACMPRPGECPCPEPAPEPKDSQKCVEEYLPGVNYTEGTLVWLVAGALYQVITDYRSSAEFEAASDNLTADIAAGNLIPISSGSGGGQGTVGPQGPPGADGKSAYEIWLDQGNSGTEQDFLDSLKGEDGKDGATGPQGPQGIQGEAGQDGEDGEQGPVGPQGEQGQPGLSAYEIWLSLGNTGTESDFIASLKGADGATGEAGQDGKDGADGNPGADGASAYDIWLAAGNSGSESEFLASLVGPQGEKGDQGDKGDPGDIGPQGNPGADGADGTSVTIVSSSKVDGSTTVVFSDGTQITVNDGADGTSINIKDSLTSSDELPSSGQEVGDCYLIDGNLWVYTADTEAGSVNGFKNAGNIQGPEGVGISKLSINESGQLVVTYTDGSSSTVGTVVGPKGDPGTDGVSIVSVEQTTSSTESGGSNVIQVKLSNGNVFEFVVTNGAKGDTGENGANITVINTEKVDGVTTVTFSDSTSIQIADGQDGATGPQGPRGQQGDTIQLRVSESGDIEYRPIDSVTGQDTYMWTSLINIHELTGPQGETGADGASPHIGDNGNWYVGDVDTGVSAQGPQGPQGETGEQGEQGAQGEQGPAATVKSFTTTLSANNWSESQITITSDLFKPSNYISIGMQSIITVAQYDALAAAKIICTEQTTGSITLKALGTVPSIDIPILIVVEGEQLDTVVTSIQLTDDTTGETYTLGVNDGTTYFEKV